MGLLVLVTHTVLTVGGWLTGIVGLVVGERRAARADRIAQPPRRDRELAVSDIGEPLELVQLIDREILDAPAARRPGPRPRPLPRPQRGAAGGGRGAR
jgi:hypothetical protein